MKSRKEVQLQSSAKDKVPIDYAFYTVILVPICIYEAMLSPTAVQLHKAMSRLY